MKLQEQAGMRDKKSRRPSVGAMNDSIQPALIAGDSFSVRVASGLTHTWTTDSWLNIWPNARCIAQEGSSNYDILKQLEDEPLQPAVINFTHLHRYPVDSEYHETNNRWSGSAYRLSIKCIKQIINRWSDHAILWTPFTGYEQLNQVYKFRVEELMQEVERVHFEGRVKQIKGVREQPTFDLDDVPPSANHMTEYGLETFRRIVRDLWCQKLKKSVALRAKL